MIIFSKHPVIYHAIVPSAKDVASHFFFCVGARSHNLYIRARTRRELYSCVFELHSVWLGGWWWVTATLSSASNTITILYIYVACDTKMVLSLCTVGGVDAMAPYFIQLVCLTDLLVSMRSGGGDAIRVNNACAIFYSATAKKRPLFVPSSLNFSTVLHTSYYVCRSYICHMCA